MFKPSSSVERASSERRTRLRRRPSRASTPRSTGLFVLALAALAAGIGGCASSPPAAKAPELAPVPPPLPALPTRAALGVPPDADQVLYVDLDELKASRELSKVLSWLDAVPCLEQERVQVLLPAIARLVVTTRSSQPEAAFAALVELGGERALGPAELLAALPPRTPPGAPRQAAPSLARFSEGRYDRYELGGHSAIALTPGLLLVGPTARVQALQRLFDDPAQGPRVDYWASRPEAFQPGEARALVWASAEVPELAARQLAGLAGAPVGKAVLGARSWGVLERSPVALRVEAELRDAGAARAVDQTLRQRLQNASLLLRLMGLPLDKRLESKQNGATLRLDLPLPEREAQRLLGFAEAAFPSIARSLCAP